jgi:O-antigen/teichoic acid export membrane protein
MFLITVLLLLSVAFFKFDLITLAWIWVAVYGVLAVVFFLIFMVKHQDVLKAKHYPIRNIYKEFIPFILPTLFSNNVAILFSKGTETALVIIKGVTDTALYNIARPISNLALAIASPIAGLLKPYISQIDETHDKSSIKRLILLVLNTGVFILIPFSILLSLNARESIVFLFGAKYAQAELTLRFMAFEIFFDIMNSFVFGIVFGLGLQKKRAKVLYVASFICFILSISLIPVFGPVGVAVANLAYSCIGTVGAVYIIKQKISFELPVKKYVTILPLILIVVVSQLLLRKISVPDPSQQFLLFMVKVAISLSLYYGIGIFVFKIVDFNVIKKIVSYLIPVKVQQLIVKQ